MTIKSTEYYLTRAPEEREFAKDFAKGKVAVIPDELAKGYDALAAKPELRPELPQAWVMGAI